MDEVKFWEIVRNINWPNTDYDEAMYWFMQNYSIEEAEAFRSLFDKKRNELVKAYGESMCCDSWEDTLAHIVGLGEKEYERNIKNPELIVQRERAMDYVESFAYCIPWADDYGKLNDDGYSQYIEGTKELVDELESADEDDVPRRCTGSIRKSPRSPVS